jgi:methanogenic corrinoid protein MtbC1
LPLVRLFGDVLQPALDEVGRRWEASTLLVAQEKEISELARDLIAELSLRHAHPDPRGPVVVAACVEGEDHELGLRMVCALLRERGYRVHLLGADVAPRFLIEAVRLHAPGAVLLSAKLEGRLPAVTAVLDALAALPAELRPIEIVGGRLAAHHQDAIRARAAIPVTDDRPDTALETLLTVLPAWENAAQP